MTIFKSDGFQGVCLASFGDAGKRFIGVYDRMPPEVRNAVRNSSFNICAACLSDRALTIQCKHNIYYGDMTLERAYLIALQEFEDRLRVTNDGI